MKTIYLIRHGEIAAGQDQRYVGALDLPLTDCGRGQIAELAEALAGIALSRVYTSPLARCRESAAILCRSLGGAVELVPEMREIDLGAWQGLTRAEIDQRFPGGHAARGNDMAGFRPPGGESFTDLLDRVWPAFTSLVAGEDQSVGLVGHAGVNRVLLSRILGLPLANIFRLGQDYGCLNLIHHGRQGFRLQTLNWRPGRQGGDGSHTLAS